jgi:tetratricopeptide (TPR) repeat protein
VTQTGNRWIVKVVLVLAVIGFVGVSMVPIIAAFNDTQRSNQNITSARNNSPSADQKSKVEDEIRGLELVLQREPENQSALKGLIQARLLLLSQKEKAAVKPSDIKTVIDPLEKLVKLNPEQTEYAVLLAQAKQQVGDREGAASTLRSILETKPGDLKALEAMVTLLLGEKRPEAAVGLLQDTLKTAAQANKIQPGSVDIIAVDVMLGNVHADQKRYAQAFSAYDQAIKKDAKDFRPVLAKAMVLKEQGKTDEAKPLFDSALALAPAQYKDEINKTATVSPTPRPTATGTPTP